MNLPGTSPGKRSESTSQSGIDPERTAWLPMKHRVPILAGCALLSTSACQPARFPETYGPVDLVVAATTDIRRYVPHEWDIYYPQRAGYHARNLAQVATIVDSLRHVSSAFPVVVDMGDIIKRTPLAYVAARVDHHDADIPSSRP